MRIALFAVVLSALLAGCGAAGESQPTADAPVPERDESAVKAEQEELETADAESRETSGNGGEQPATDRPQAPEISGPTIDGDEIALSEFRGKPVFVKVWASW